MTTIKVDGKLSSNASVSLETLAGTLFRTPGMRIVGVVELAAIERTEPAPDEDKEPSVKLAIKHLEIGLGDQEHNLRSALRALYAMRTASGTLDETDAVEFSERTLSLIAGQLAESEAARMRVVAASWQRYAEQAQRSGLTKEGLLKELKAIADGLGAALTWSGA